MLVVPNGYESTIFVSSISIHFMGQSHGAFNDYVYNQEQDKDFSHDFDPAWIVRTRIVASPKPPFCPREAPVFSCSIPGR